jgi:hypothetical protein
MEQINYQSSAVSDNLGKKETRLAVRVALEAQTLLIEATLLGHWLFLSSDLLSQGRRLLANHGD